MGCHASLVDISARVPLVCSTACSNVIVWLPTATSRSVAGSKLSRLSTLRLYFPAAGFANGGWSDSLRQDDGLICK